MLNRAAIIVRPARPFIEWAKALDESGMVPDDGESTVYLVPEYLDDEEGEEILERVFPIIFENELNGWHTLESDWPRDRSYEVFMMWFRVEVHPVVEDLCGYGFTDE